MAARADGPVNVAALEVPFLAIGAGLLVGGIVLFLLTALVPILRLLLAGTVLGNVLGVLLLVWPWVVRTAAAVLVWLSCLLPAPVSWWLSTALLALLAPAALWVIAAGLSAGIIAVNAWFIDAWIHREGSIRQQ